MFGNLLYKLVNLGSFRRHPLEKAPEPATRNVLYKKVFLMIPERKQLCWSLFLIKLQAWSPEHLLVQTCQVSCILRDFNSFFPTYAFTQVLPNLKYSWRILHRFSSSSMFIFIAYGTFVQIAYNFSSFFAFNPNVPKIQKLL